MLRKVYAFQNVGSLSVRIAVGQTDDDAALMTNFLIVKAIIMVNGNQASGYVSSLSKTRAVIVVDYLTENNTPMVESIVFEIV